MPKLPVELSFIQSPTVDPGTFAQFVLDNCDVNLNTIYGYGTFHNMADIMCVTPAEAVNYSGDRVTKQTKLTQSSFYS